MDYLNSTIADNVSLHLIKNGNNTAGALTGGFAYYSLGKAIEKKGVGIANASWNVQSTILGVLSGYLLYGEDMDMKKILGISLGIIGLYLMNEPHY